MTLLEHCGKRRKNKFNTCWGSATENGYQPLWPVHNNWLGKHCTKNLTAFGCCCPFAIGCSFKFRYCSIPNASADTDLLQIKTSLKCFLILLQRHVFEGFFNWVSFYTLAVGLTLSIWELPIIYYCIPSGGPCFCKELETQAVVRHLLRIWCELQPMYHMNRSLLHDNFHFNGLT